MKYFNIFFIACGIFTIICIGYEVLNIPITFNIDKEYTGFILEEESGREVTIKLTGKLKKRLISVDKFDGIIEIDDVKYDAWFQEAEVGNGVFVTVNRDVIGGMLYAYNSLEYMGSIYIDSKLKQLVIYQNNNSKIIVPAKTFDEAIEQEDKFYKHIYQN